MAATMWKHGGKTGSLRWDSSRSSGRSCGRQRKGQHMSAPAPSTSVSPVPRIVIAGAGPAAQALVRQLDAARFRGTVTVLSNRDDAPAELLELAELPQVSVRFGQPASFIDPGHRSGTPTDGMERRLADRAIAPDHAPSAPPGVTYRPRAAPGADAGPQPDSVSRASPRGFRPSRRPRPQATGRHCRHAVQPATPPRSPGPAPTSPRPSPPQPGRGRVAARAPARPRSTPSVLPRPR